jgi:hypothetical protein
MDQLIQKVIRKEMGLGFQSAYRMALDVVGGVTTDGRQYCWGIYDYNTRVLTPEFHDALVGYVTGVGVKASEFKDKENYNLIVHVDCGSKQYSLKSGLTSVFSKGLMNAFCGLPDGAGRNPLKIIVKPGEDSSGKVVLSTLCIPGAVRDEWVKPKYQFPKDIGEVRAVFREVIEIFPKLDFERSQQQGDAA